MSLPTAFEPRPAVLPKIEESAICLEGVTVRYRVPHEPIRSIKEYTIRSLFQRLQNDEYLALREVSVQVKRGEVFGIVGRNGAGKSTLLKVVSRVLCPTAGRVWVSGWVAPLLELGAGFHPELTGRENIFLNGTLLGHTRREIQARFEQIVDFAELDEFIDAPLRTYSTGMSARLGFAVATAWEPDILILDEVLGVGDESFQRKCQSKLASFREAGTTVLLVSHNMEQVKAMCHRALWLDRGVIRGIGRAEEIVQQYQHASS
jgi:ABC-type polysaccharide/polyol phosphate transport system ATPase subunit